MPSRRRPHAADIPTLLPDDDLLPPKADAPIVEQEPLGSGETSDSPSDLPDLAARDPEAPVDADMPLDVMSRRQGERGPPEPPRRDETGIETEGAGNDGDLDEDEDPDLGFIDDARRDDAPDASSSPDTGQGADRDAPP